MVFCPFYNLQCPEANEGTGGCAIWTESGCCMIDKPGVRASYTAGDPVDVYILQIFSSNAKAAGDILIIFANCDTGEIGTDDTLANFTIHPLQ